MLEHPQALQVAGDAVAGFYRRWSPDGAGKPSVPWKLEAYSWGGLTEAPLASASWLLLAPFMMYNVAYFMLPSTVAGSEPVVIEEPVPHLRRDRGHQIAHALLRLLAMAATVQFVSAAATVTMSTVAWQAAGPVHLLLPSWMGWYGGVDRRMAGCPGPGRGRPDHRRCCGGSASRPRASTRHGPAWRSPN